MFGCTYANVQPHSGAQANLAVFFALVKPGDTVMGMSLDAGGHLTHGSKVNISGTYFNIVSYGVNEDGYIDYEQVRKIAVENKPKLIVAGASAYARKIDFKKFREIADEVGAYLMVDMAHIAGLVAGGQHMSPIPYAHVTTTTTHKTLRGPRGGLILSSEEFALEHKLNKAVFPGIQGGPLMHVIAAKAVCFEEALKPEYKEYMEQVVKNEDKVNEKKGEYISRLISIKKGMENTNTSFLFEKYKITKTSSIELLIDAISEDNESDKEEYLKLVFQSNEESQEELNTLMNKNFIEVTYLCLKTYISV